MRIKDSLIVTTEIRQADRVCKLHFDQNTMTITMRITVLVSGFIPIILAMGCSGTPSRVTAPTIPSDAAQVAIARFDKNGNQALDGAELNEVPSIKSALRRIDSNQDNQVSADELASRIQSWRDSKVGMMQVAVAIVMDGQPLAGAEVRITPEEFLGGAIQSASAVTNNAGRAALRISDEPGGAGVQLGLYRMTVSKQTGGKEIIPEKYNSQSELGCEIAMDNSLGDGDWIIKLSSR